MRQIAGAALGEIRDLARGTVRSTLILGGKAKVRRLRPALAAWLLLGVALPARATIRYEISLAHPAQHLFHVVMTIPDVRQNVVVQIPAWNALYQIRDFGYHVLGLHASGAAAGALRVSRLDKQTWTIQGQGEVRVEYSAYWDEPGPFGTQLNGDHAFLNLAMVLCYVPDRRAEEAVVRFADVPQAWRIAVELPGAIDASQAAGAEAYAASSYDALVDAPVEIGPLDEFDFQAAGRTIRVAVHGDSLDHARTIQMLTKIVEYETKLMGDAPFGEYLFSYHVGRGFGLGGMEHANGTAISVGSPGALLNVSAHEFFHLWNVKRIRPQSLEPVDYTREMWTPSLWFAEGVTNTYASYTLVRTGLWSKAEFLADLGDQISELESRSARRWQSAEESSRDAWFEKYPLYDNPDLSVSYYNKGQLLGLGLDIVIRDATDNRASLDDVMRALNRQYAQRGLFYAESGAIRAAAEQAINGAAPGANVNLGDFFARFVAGTEELPLADWLSRAGLGLRISGQRRMPQGEEQAQNYIVEELPRATEKQMRIRGGLLQGTTDAAPARGSIGTAGGR